MESMKDGSPVGKGGAKSVIGGNDDDGKNTLKPVAMWRFERGSGSRDGREQPSNSGRKDQNIIHGREDSLDSARVSILEELKQENERLRITLAQMRKNYQSLQMRFLDVVRGDDRGRKPEALEKLGANQETDDSELVSLSLAGTGSGGHRKEEKAATAKKENGDGERMKEELSLGLPYEIGGDCDRARESQTNGTRAGDAPEQAPGKRARVSVRVRCDMPTMADGCQWRKYGQKISKGNPCPRAYYRCTTGPACPVRKQVQRSAEEMSILITTYEGTHTHPLPASATAMASTTSAAAALLTSGSSSTSRLVAPGSFLPVPTAACGDDHTAGRNMISSGLHGLNYFSLPDTAGRRAVQLYPASSTVMLWSSPSCPTITLDLTSPSPTSASSCFPSSASCYPATIRQLPFSSPHRSNFPPIAWSKNNSSTKNHVGSIPDGAGRAPDRQDSVLRIGEAGSSPPALAAALPPLAGTAIVAAATKAIASDPSFQSALAAAITSAVEGDGSPAAVAEALRKNLRWGGRAISPSSSSAPSTNGNGCASSYLTRSSSST